MRKFLPLLTLTLLAILAPALRAGDAMFESPRSRPATVPSTQTLVFAGRRAETAYNNHAYLARFGDRFFAIWSSGANGAHTGQRVRWAHSGDGEAWSEAQNLALPGPGRYLIARGLWVREGELYALAASCTGQTTGTEVASLEAWRWHASRQTWEAAGTVYDRTLNNYAPVRMPDGAWLMGRRDRPNRITGYLRGGVAAIDAWREIPVTLPEGPVFTEPQIFIAGDGDVVTHYRANGSHRLWRSVRVNSRARARSEPAVDAETAATEGQEGQGERGVGEGELLLAERIGLVHAESGDEHRDQDEEGRGPGEQAGGQEEASQKLRERRRPAENRGRRKTEPLRGADRPGGILHLTEPVGEGHHEAHVNPDQSEYAVGDGTGHVSAADQE